MAETDEKSIFEKDHEHAHSHLDYVAKWHDGDTRFSGPLAIVKSHLNALWMVYQDQKTTLKETWKSLEDANKTIAALKATIETLEADKIGKPAEPKGKK